MSTGLSPYKPFGERNLYMGVAHRTNQSRPPMTPPLAETAFTSRQRKGRVSVWLSLEDPP